LVHLSRQNHPTPAGKFGYLTVVWRKNSDFPKYLANADRISGK